MANKGRELTLDERRELLSLKREDITRELLQDYFACYYGKSAARFETYDTFTLPAGAFYNDKPIETTIGRYLVNMYVLPPQYLKKYGYYNEVITKSSLGKLESVLGDMILNDEISTKEFAAYLNNGEWLSMSTDYFLCPSFDYEINVPIPEVIKLRDDLFEKYKDGVKAGDNNVAAAIESEVLSLAKKKVLESGNDSYDMFASEIGSFENNYKKSSIMAGAIEDPYTKKLSILKSNYVDGIDKKEYPKFGALTLIGGYSRGVESQASGYDTKKINNAFQAVTLDEHGSDCGTKYFATVTIHKGLAGLFRYRYILDPSSPEKDESGLVLLTPANISKYIGKTVKMRSPMFCKGEHICNKCAGELFYKIGMTNAGLVTATLGGVLLNLGMKKFHDATIRFFKIDISNYIKKG